MFGTLDTEERGGKWASFTPSAISGEDAVGLWSVLGVKEAWTRVSQREWSLWQADKEGENIGLAGGTSLEVPEMVANDFLDVDAGGDG
eukprot:g31746.t1